LGNLASHYAVPTICGTRFYPEIGGLMSYGASLADAYHQAGAFAGRILKGEKPAEMPVAEPTKFELVLNIKTAKRLGLVVPPAMLAQATKIIQ
jgi:putative tryptophan/tyrosine transport system substrate-binding protein